jgi:hypothetical protein
MDVNSMDPLLQERLLVRSGNNSTADGTDEEYAAYDEYNNGLEPDPMIASTFPRCLHISILANVVSCCCLPISILAGCGFAVVPERQHAAVLYFGKYSGSIQTPGIHWLPPFGAEWRFISTATRTMNMKDLKVLDPKGNPVVISVVVTFEPISAKKARIDVENPWPFCCNHSKE